MSPVVFLVPGWLVWDDGKRASGHLVRASSWIFVHFPAVVSVASSEHSEAESADGSSKSSPSEVCSQKRSLWIIRRLSEDGREPGKFLWLTDAEQFAWTSAGAMPSWNAHERRADVWGNASNSSRQHRVCGPFPILGMSRMLESTRYYPKPIRIHDGTCTAWQMAREMYI